MNRSCVTRAALAWGLAVALAPAWPALADDPFFMGLGHLPGGTYSCASAVSADGSVVVGDAAYATLRHEAFRWTLETGMEGLGFLPGGSGSGASGVSADGTVIVGSGGSAPGWQAFRWTRADGMVGLGDLPGGDFSSAASDVSGDGSLVVGTSRSGQAHYLEAFRWTAQEGMVGLGDLDGGIFYSQASDVSGDAAVIVGCGYPESGREAFRWTAEGGMVGLGDLNDDSAPFSRAYAVSWDGSVIVGRGSSEHNGSEAFRWTAEEGMVGLGDLPGGPYESFAYDVSADGSLIVGYSWTYDHPVAFIWDAPHGMRNLNDVLSDEYGLDLSGWRLSAANAISADGLTIVGGGYNPFGQIEAWIAHIPEPSTLCLLSLAVVALGKRQGH